MGISSGQTIEDYIESLNVAMRKASVEATVRAGFGPEEIFRLPEATLTSISKNGEVVITFSKEINFPEEMITPS